MKIASSRPGVKKEYEALEDEFNLIREMVKACGYSTKKLLVINIQISNFQIKQ